MRAANDAPHGAVCDCRRPIGALASPGGWPRAGPTSSPWSIIAWPTPGNVDAPITTTATCAML